MGIFHASDLLLFLFFVLTLQVQNEEVLFHCLTFLVQSEVAPCFPLKFVLYTYWTKFRCWTTTLQVHTFTMVVFSYYTSLLFDLQKTIERRLSVQAVHDIIETITHLIFLSVHSLFFPPGREML